MLQRFLDYIDRQHLFPPGKQVLLAVSGGRDSVCLAHLCHRAKLPFAVAHCNFHLRPGDCDRDQQFVARLADGYGVPFHTVDFDTRAYAAAHGQSLEEAARELRYEYFAQLLTLNSQLSPVVATAHHRDDSIETFFLNLFRGTGIAGLHGIRPKSQLSIANCQLSIVRPLLPFSRVDIDDYVARHGLEYVEDYTNAELDARRNRIRHQLMPLLRELYPSVDDTMQANIGRLHDTELIYRAYIDELRQRLIQPCPSRIPYLDLHMQAIDLAELTATNLPLVTLLYELLQSYGFSAPVVADISAALHAPRTGSCFRSSSHEAVIDRDRLVVSSLAPVVAPTLSVTAVPQPSAVGIPQVEYIDAASVSLPLTVRPWQAADRFHPFGMRGSRLVSDFLKDQKLNVIEKRHVHVAVDADGRIVWVVGFRLDDRFRLSETTTQALSLSIL